MNAFRSGTSSHANRGANTERDSDALRSALYSAALSQCMVRRQTNRNNIPVMVLWSSVSDSTAKGLSNESGFECVDEMWVRPPCQSPCPLSWEKKSVSPRWPLR